MKLRVGDTIPAFWTRDIQNNVIDSKALGAYTLLVFLRYAGCPLCNLAIVRLSHEYKLLKKDKCEVVAFVSSSQENIEKNILGRHNPEPPFPLVSDQPGDFYHLFGIEPDVIKTVKYTAKHASHWLNAAFRQNFMQSNIDGNGFIIPAFFLVNEHGVIELADYAANFYDDETFTKIYEHLTFNKSTS